jgi:hypothetical protein
MNKKKDIFSFVIKVLTILFFVFSFCSFSNALLVISEVFPNTIDDKNLEYIKIKNL